MPSCRPLGAKEIRLLIATILADGGPEDFASGAGMQVVTVLRAAVGLAVQAGVKDRIVQHLKEIHGK